MLVFVLWILTATVLLATTVSNQGDQNNAMLQLMNPFGYPTNNTGLEKHTLFANYHITHHAGTALWYFARTQVVQDGMNGIFNINVSHHANITKMKESQVNQWFQIVPYMMKGSADNVYHHGIDRISRGARKMQVNLTDIKDVKFSMRQFVNIEQRLTEGVWAAFPVGWNDGTRQVKTMVIMKNPMLRSIAGGRDGAFKTPNHVYHRKYGNLGNYVKRESNNYALRWMTGIDIKAEITEQHYHIAIERLQQFDHVAIAECLEESTQYICKEWGWHSCNKLAPKASKTTRHPRLRFGNDSWYEDFLHENVWDFKLYDFAVALAKQQMGAKGYSTARIERLPKDSLQVLRDDLKVDVETLKEQQWRA